jgi:hypothetical protein
MATPRTWAGSVVVRKNPMETASRRSSSSAAWGMRPGSPIRACQCSRRVTRKWRMSPMAYTVVSWPARIRVMLSVATSSGRLSPRLPRIDRPHQHADETSGSHAALSLLNAPSMVNRRGVLEHPVDIVYRLISHTLKSGWWLTGSSRRSRSNVG